MTYQTLLRQMRLRKDETDEEQLQVIETKLKKLSKQINRVKRNQEYNGWVNQNKAATNIQRVYKGHLEKDYLLRILEFKYFDEMKEPSLKLQSIYRSQKEQINSKSVFLIRQLREKITNAIIQLQARIKQIKAQKQVKFACLVKTIMDQREQASITIQKHFKKSFTQRLYQSVLEFEKNFISITWNCQDYTPSKVQVIGSFTSPPWQKYIDLDLCPLRKIFVKYMSNIGEGTYLIKFIVDGQYRCDPRLPQITDAYGNLNNILDLGYENSQESEGRSQSMSFSSSLVRGLKGYEKQSQQTKSSRRLKIKQSKDVISKEKLILLDQQSMTSSMKNKLIEQLYQNKQEDYEEEEKVPKNLQLDEEQVSIDQKERQNEIDQITIDNPSQQLSIYERLQQFEEEKVAKKKQRDQLMPYQEFYEENPVQQIIQSKPSFDLGVNEFSSNEMNTQFDDYYLHYYYQDEPQSATMSADTQRNPSQAYQLTTSSNQIQQIAEETDTAHDSASQIRQHTQQNLNSQSSSKQSNKENLF